MEQTDRSQLIDRTADPAPGDPPGRAATAGGSCLHWCATRRFFPRIELTALAGNARNHFSGLLRKKCSWGWTLAPQLFLNLFDAGRNQAGLPSATTGRDIAVAQYKKAIETAFREVADALAGRATLGEQLRAQQAQAQANAEGVRFKLSELRYQNGIASQLDLLDAQRSLFSARQAVVQTRLLQIAQSGFPEQNPRWRLERRGHAGHAVSPGFQRLSRSEKSWLTSRWPASSSRINTMTSRRSAPAGNFQ